MNLGQALSLEAGSTVAFVGAGGKTTAIFQAAKQLAGTVLISTTTHFGKEQASLADMHMVIEPEEEFLGVNGENKKVVLITGRLTQDDRWRSLTQDQLDQLRRFAKENNYHLLIEADGARGRPIKAPAAHEPAIPTWAEHVVVVVGLSAINKYLLPQYVHRPDEFALCSGIESGAEITADGISKMLIAPDGGLKNIPENATRIVLLNQADDTYTQSIGGLIARSVLPLFPRILVASLREVEQFQVSAGYTQLAGILLAAGSSRRLGRPKALLEYHGETFVHRAARTAIEAGLFPVVIITGEFDRQIREAVKDLPVDVIHNSDFATGQASSIRTGLENLPRSAGGAIFVLVDQPLVTPEVIHQLKLVHAGTLAPVIAPEIDGKRGNPVLFDRATFKDLSKISGDEGGRQIFSKYSPRLIPWYDGKIGLDVDTPGDYKRLEELE